MPEQSRARSRAGIEMNFAFGKARDVRPEPNPDAPFRMLVLGDFGGHRSRTEVRASAGFRPERVDMDSFPALIRKLQPRIELDVGDQPRFTIAISDLEDFHPDHLYATLDFFAPMRELRRQLQDPKTFDLAAAMLGAVTPLSPSPAGEASEKAPAKASDPHAHDEDLQRLLGKAPSTPSLPDANPTSPTSPTSIVDALIRDNVAPHVVKKADPRQADLVATVDAMTGELMRAVLHHPSFQQVEALWRGLDRMLRTVDLDETLQVFVMDVSREELVQDLTAHTESAIVRLVTDHGGPQPWSLLVDLNGYGHSQEDAALLSHLGTIAQEVSAALVAGTDLAAWSAGASTEDEQAWATLRRLPVATSVAVALPDILLRLPYGQATDPVERFAFTEQTTPPVASHYLWGSAALAVAQLLAQSYAHAGGWDFTPGDESTIDDLPIHITKADGESVQTPCAQAWLPESKIDALIKKGLMPLVSAHGRGEVRIPRFQSIALPPAALAGRWQGR